MRLDEVALPDTADGMKAFGKSLTASLRSLAAHHGITIDGGGGGIYTNLPLYRKDIILDGGYLRPLDGIRGEKVRTEPFEKRVRA